MALLQHVASSVDPDVPAQRVYIDTEWATFCVPFDYFGLGVPSGSIAPASTALGGRAFETHKLSPP